MNKPPISTGSFLRSTVAVAIPGRADIMLPPVLGSGFPSAITKILLADLPTARVTVRHELQADELAWAQTMKSHDLVHGHYASAIRERRAGLGLLSRLNLLPDYLAGAA